MEMLFCLEGLGGEVQHNYIQIAKAMSLTEMLVAKGTDSGARSRRFKSCLIFFSNQESYLTSPCLSLLICRMRYKSSPYRALATVK